ncbi:ABC transporter permease [Rhizobium leguminosarum]|uniref:ABC transporter permease n=1 Tax=Rhizobium leguminosarum TaxID=384 RepID=UPI001C8FBF10|nr:ABC transporter permease [Rhizobium leguminosarum]MBY2915363.1 ABC transporter permease [Rhizobium leguminosarum]MBY2970901.1 ABC transporter permease [Rhizobium leguminosarum]MBY2977968.1 ABC transporter permease [Rhizobium leguminosarum]MBY3006518.1 ABC transporter permease [Rhizobium leguminosarum]
MKSATKAPRRNALWVRLSPALTAGALIVFLALVIAICPQWFATHDPELFDYDALLVGPSVQHWFGTDSFGRDIYSRVIWAFRVDLQMAVFATVFSVIFGTVMGASVGFFGGILDTVVGRVIDVIVIFPFLVLIIAIVALLGPGLINMYIAMTAVGWVFYCRLMRAEIRVQKNLDYAAAARGLGYSNLRIVVRHLIPNAMTPVLIYWMTDMALAVLLGSSLGYLGLGAQPPEAEWGVLIADGKNYIETAWWMSVFPGVAILLLGLGLSLLSDGLAEYFNRQEHA